VGSPGRLVGLRGRLIMYQPGSLLYRENECAKVQLGISRHLPHEANLLHVYFDMQIRRVCKLLPAGHLANSEFVPQQNALKEKAADHKPSG
jgi:hypothetical protein